MAKYKRKLMPFLSCDIPAIEKWLCDMAGQGYLYESSGVFSVRFEVSEPKERRYRLEYADVVGCRIKDEKREMYEDCGWTVVNDIKSDLVVVYTDEKDAPEPYDEPEQMLEPLEKIRKKQITIGIVFVVMFFLCKIAYPLRAAMMGDNDILHAFLSMGTGLYISFCVMAVLVLTEGIFRLVRAKRLKQYIENLKCNGKCEVKEVRKNGFGTAMILVSIPLVVFFAAHFFMGNGGTRLYATEPDAEFPFPILEEISAEEHEQIINSTGNLSDREESDLLAPRIIELWEESYDSPNRYWVNYYEMRNEKLAKKLYEEELSGFTELNSVEAQERYNLYLEIARSRGKDEAELFLQNSSEKYEVREMQNDNAQVVYISEYISNNTTGSELLRYQYLIILKDETVLRVQYYGEKDLSSFADLFVSRMGN